MGSGGTILATTNGVATWSRRSSGSTTYLNAVCFADTTRMRTVGCSGTILAAGSGGVTPPPPAPSITKLKPASGKRGALVTITGAHLGASQGISSVKFGSKAVTKYVSWSDAQIKCRVPAKAKYGVAKVTVATSAGTSNAKNFKVRR